MDLHCICGFSELPRFFFQGEHRGSVYYFVSHSLCPLGVNSAYWINQYRERDKGPYRIILLSSFWPKYNFLFVLYCLFIAQCSQQRSDSVRGVRVEYPHVAVVFYFAPTDITLCHNTC